MLLIIPTISDLHEIKYFEVDKPLFCDRMIAFERKRNNLHDTVAVFFRIWSLLNQMKCNPSFASHRHREIQHLVCSLTFRNLRQ